jgi:hypothetical protein
LWIIKLPPGDTKSVVCVIKIKASISFGPIFSLWKIFLAKSMLKLIDDWSSLAKYLSFTPLLEKSLFSISAPYILAISCLLILAEGTAAELEFMVKFEED